MTRLFSTTRTGRRTALRKYFLTLLTATLLAACGKSAEKADKPSVTVSIEPLRYFTEAVAGDKFHVTSMVPEGSNPETYDPTPQQMVQLAKSRAYFSIGRIGFERAWIDKLKSNAPDMPFYDMSEGIAPIIEHAHKDSHELAHADPHIWNSTANARLIAANVCRALCKTDPAHTTYFESRKDSLMEAIDETERKIREEMADADQAFLIYHPALTYFARDYGLTQVCIETEGKEPSPAYLQQLIRQCRDKHIRVVFIQQEFDRRNAEAIAKELDLTTVSINPLSYRWDEEMLRTARALGRNRQTPKQEK